MVLEFCSLLGSSGASQELLQNLALFAIGAGILFSARLLWSLAGAPSKFGTFLLLMLQFRSPLGSSRTLQELLQNLFRLFIKRIFKDHVRIVERMGKAPLEVAEKGPRGSSESWRKMSLRIL
jgi:hypothetical protein